MEPEGEKDHSPKPLGPLAIGVTKTTELGARGGGEQCPRSFWLMSGCFIVCSPWRTPQRLGTKARSSGISAPWRPGAPAVTAFPQPGAPSFSSPGTVQHPVIASRQGSSLILSLRDAFREPQPRGLRWASPPGGISLANCSSSPRCDVSSEPQRRREGLSEQRPAGHAS